MGAYINPPVRSKEQWLAENADRISKPKSFDEIPNDKFILILVDSGMFTALGVAYNENEFTVMVTNDDPRDRTFFYADRELVKTVSNVNDYL